MTKTDLQTSGPRRRGITHWAWLIAALLLIIVGAAAWWWWSGRLKKPSVPGGPRLSPQEKLILLAKTNQAVALLENEGDLPGAAELFMELAEKLPQERLAWQNRVIALLLQVKQDDPAVAQTAQTCQSALEELLTKFPTAEAYWLAAQFMARLPRVPETERASKIVELLEQAQRLDPNNPVYPMGIYEALTSGGIIGGEEKARQALATAYQKAPQNLHVLVEYLVMQAESRDMQIRDTLQAARRVVAPLWRSILGGDNLGRDDAVSSLGRNVLEMIDQGLAAVDAGNWQQVHILALQLRNGIGPLIAHRNDWARISPHPLAFVVHDYSEQFYEELPPPAHQTVAVQFTPPQALMEDEEKAPSPVVDFLLADFDLDRQDDWIVLYDDQVRVYKKAQDGTLADQIASLDLPPGMRGILAGDLDNDHLAAARTGAETGQGPNVQPSTWHQADLDLVVFGKAGILVLENRRDDDGRRRLILREQPDIAAPPGDVHAAVLVDFDHDADLDIVFATEQAIGCWSGRGNGTFEDVTSYCQLPERAVVRRFVPVDWDRDGDIDIVCADQSGQPALLENMLHGHLAWRTLPVEGMTAPVGDLAVAELDGNASWDLIVATSAGLVAAWTQTVPGSLVRFTDRATLSQGNFTRVLVADFDNSGFLDILAWNAENIELFQASKWRNWNAWPILPMEFRPVAVRAYDVDRDGDLDLVYVQDGRLYVSFNQGGNTNQWLQFRIVGQCDNKGCSGHTGIGSLIEIKSENHYQAQTVVSDTTHFGLGYQKQADIARIVWTNGVPQNIVAPRANQYITEQMTLKGSCPYLYTWDGQKFVFVTDCLWAAPLGMQSARGVLAPWRAWEYLKIPGDLLQPREGLYEIRLTEELWEAAYFDQIELITVDHPEDVAIYSNEKVGPTEIAQFAIHTARRPLRPIAARDQKGRDVLPLLIAEDDQYVAAWDRRLMQGLTEPHYIELDLGPLENPQRILLFLTGWIYPANTSLNVAFTNNPQLEAPRPPSIWTPGPDGQWRLAMEYMGFPGGKTKTIVVDVSRIFTPGDYRLRIATTAEIYWDGVFFTVDEEAAPLSVQRLPVVNADLHYRGFSQRIPYQNNRPERYIYQQVETAPRWPPLRGRLTRYGSVSPLLLQQDNQLVVLGPGDELAVSFSVPPDGPPAGWKRDFLLYCVGWDKDADLNTIWGQSVEPLPYHGMKEYPYAPHNAPQDEAYREYLRLYQTRELVPGYFWNQIRDWPWLSKQGQSTH